MNNPFTDLRSARARVVFVHDVLMAALSFLVSLYLRLGSGLFDFIRLESALQSAAIFGVVAGAVFLFMRMYAGVWRYASLSDLMAILKAVTLAILVFLPLMFLLTRLEDLPRSVLIINWFVMMAMIGGPRFLYRMVKDRRLELKRTTEQRRIPVLLVGAGDAAELFIRAMQREAEAQYQVVGILGHNASRVGRRIHGVPVLGTTTEMAEAVERLTREGLRPQKVILTREDLDGGAVRQLLEQADALGLTLARLPRLTEFKAGVQERMEVRAVALEDLLGRPQTVLDRAGMAALIAGRRVMVTGAGGSIGAELSRQISDLGPVRLCLLDASEYALYGIDMEMAGRHPDLARAAVLCDVRDAARLDAVFGQERPELVFHAAALKHVPLVEANPLEGLSANTLGTRRVADACRVHGARAMVQISTDKAVNPTNVMGASKRMAELYCQALDARAKPGETRFVTVRFGNVLGSTGSVVPLFQKQLAEGGPLTVTHPEMTRYFMTIREAVELVLQASALGLADAAHAGKLFVLDMGEPVKIVDLARQMIRLAGLKPDDDVAIRFTGLRPGEKLFEEIFHGAEPPIPTERKGILVAAPRPVDLAALSERLDVLDAACRANQTERALAVMKELVPEYGGQGATDTRRQETRTPQDKARDSLASGLG